MTVSGQICWRLRDFFSRLYFDSNLSGGLYWRVCRLFLLSFELNNGLLRVCFFEVAHCCTLGGFKNNNKTNFWKLPGFYSFLDQNANRASHSNRAYCENVFLMQLCESVLLITFLLHSILVPNIHWIIDDKAISHLYYIFMYYIFIKISNS